MKEFTPQVKAVNAAATELGKALMAFKKVCDKNGHPITGVTFRVLDKGQRKLKITYKKEVKCPKTKT